MEKDLTRELTLLHAKFPGCLSYIVDAANAGRLDGSDYEDCGLAYIVANVDYDFSPSTLGSDIAEELYATRGLYLELEDLLRDVEFGDTPDNCGALEELVEAISKVE